MDMVENYSQYTPSLEASSGRNCSQEGPQSLSSRVALPEEKGKGCMLVAPMIPMVGNLQYSLEQAEIHLYMWGVGYRIVTPHLNEESGIKYEEMEIAYLFIKTYFLKRGL